MFSITFFILVFTAEVMIALEKGIYGSPVSIDLIVEEATARGVTLDIIGYEKLQQESMVREIMSFSKNILW